MSDGADAIGLPGQSDFPGAGPAVYRINADSTLSYADAAHAAPAPAFPDTSKVIQISSLQPKFLNAPAQLFKGQDKVGSYLRIQVSQTDDLVPLKSLLSWTTYPQLNTAPHQDFGSRPIVWTAADDQAMTGITIANASGALSITLFAVVGPPAKDIWSMVDGTFQKLMAIAQQTEGTALALPAADLVLANLIESQIGNAIKAFEPTSTQQIWIFNDPISFLFTEPPGGTSGNGTSIALPDKTMTTVILVPSSSNKGDQRQLNAAMQNNTPGSPGYDPHYPTWQFDASGATSYQAYLETFLAGGASAGSYQFDASYKITRAPKDTNGFNPFDYVPYITLNLMAHASSTPNPN